MASQFHKLPSEIVDPEGIFTPMTRFVFNQYIFRLGKIEEYKQYLKDKLKYGR